MKKLQVTLDRKVYQIDIRNNILTSKEFLSYIKNLNERVVIITDDNVKALHGISMYRKLKDNGIWCDIISIKGGEINKNYNSVLQIYKNLIGLSIDRNTYFISLGGGVVGDIAGFVCATFMRGVKFIQIPTTFLSQIDSSIGGKVGYNIDDGKNLIGAFYHPEKVIIDPRVLNTLTDKYFRDGISEAIKASAIKNKDLFSTFEDNNIDFIKKNLENIIYTCVDIKRQVVEKDVRETGDRKLLNFGHTIGHGIEGYYKYKKYTHGEAVAIGMYYMCRIGENLEITKKGVSSRMEETLSKYKLPFFDTCDDVEGLVEIISKDKKSKGKEIDIILLKDIGEGILYSISKEKLKEEIHNLFIEINNQFMK